MWPMDKKLCTARIMRMLVVAIAALAIGCRSNSFVAAPVPAHIGEAIPRPANETSNTDAESKPAASPTRPSPITYRAVPIRGKKSWDELRSKFGEEGIALVLKINRVDRRHVKVGDTLAVPGNITDWLALSPFPPEIESASGIVKLILVSRRAQAFGAYESGKLIYWGPTSTGKKATSTPQGLYHANWKSKETRSTINQDWILPWYFNLDNHQGIAFHQYDLPGYPASHGCVRLLEADARWIYGWADSWILSEDRRSRLAHGTPVIIFGDYAYGKQPPWKRLYTDPNAANVSLAEIDAVLQRHLAVIEEREQLRAAARAPSPAQIIVQQK